MKNVLAILTLATLVAAPLEARQATAPEQGDPPTGLTQRDGFWTANNAPPNEEDFEVHVVVMGDTLWALAQQYMDDPFLWPQLWETNEHIINPHWIYPGDRVLIRPITRITEAEPPPPPPAPEPEPVDEPEPPRVVTLPNLTDDIEPIETAPFTLDLPALESAPEVKAKDLYCSNFVRTSEISDRLRVVAKAPGTASDGLYSVLGDYVYLSQGSADGVAPGDRFTAVRPTRDVDSPRANVGRLGRHYLEAGQLETVTVQPEFSLARVIHSCDAISPGDRLVPFREINFPELPSNRPFSSGMATSGDTVGAIAGTLPVLLIIEPELGASTALAGVRTGHLADIRAGMSGEGQIVYIDLGSADGVGTGDLFLISRPVNLDGRLDGLDDATRDALRSQREVIGELVVVKAEQQSATALITFAADGVSQGDRIDRR